MAEKLLATLQSLLHLQPEQAGFGAGHGARVVALLLVELVAALIQSIDLALPVSPCLRPSVVDEMHTCRWHLASS